MTLRARPVRGPCLASPCTVGSGWSEATGRPGGSDSDCGVRVTVTVRPCLTASVTGTVTQASQAGSAGGRPRRPHVTVTSQARVRAVAVTVTVTVTVTSHSLGRSASGPARAGGSCGNCHRGMFCDSSESAAFQRLPGTERTAVATAVL